MNEYISQQRPHSNTTKFAFNKDFATDSKKIKNVYISQIHVGTFSSSNFERPTLIKFSKEANSKVQRQSLISCSVLPVSNVISQSN